MGLVQGADKADKLMKNVAAAEHCIICSSTTAVDV